MAREFSRTDRVSQQVHKEVASILQNEYKHRVGDMPLITVSDVDVTRDLAHAKIYVTIYNSTEEEGKRQIKQLAEFQPFIRSILAKRLRMRSVPHLHFFEDKSIIEGMRISNLVSQTVAADDAKRDTDESEEKE
ncbi:30S ribosome-binding factor RbfA [Alteromonas sp. KS69]|jgi:ribosome-binding factor A|uniref:Ribosome-binding factor A n=2 Tax=Alteromonas TaxID=226 RepID=A0AAW7YZ17_9ALTE|nr:MULTISPECIES: 30S ribosome-binding factor RbfA [Alteromonas]AMJ90941.1 ribosome-binding factor A [Alteromonas sp. Mac2]MBB68130.1 30S ribosome-binding factor RbfA [Rickettsiales bacterium]PHS57217.1 MAG: 30S ribosome-binding factor RbfA [Alteromonas sp.]AEF02874.1 ribosome-binding factor A [Alteromonas naphthalenivorans]ALM90350.1 Ribosome-binding factor A [Alteromonas stellipolaris LMG 21856]|tara:strand:+ start:6004 stop:6405 length:402 start_codon:yes stop_codon:yes gene_type:complete